MESLKAHLFRKCIVLNGIGLTGLAFLDEDADSAVANLCYVLYGEAQSVAKISVVGCKLGVTITALNKVSVDKRAVRHALLRPSS